MPLQHLPAVEAVQLVALPVGMQPRHTFWLEPTGRAHKETTVLLTPMQQSMLLTQFLPCVGQQLTHLPVPATSVGSHLPPQHLELSLPQFLLSLFCMQQKPDRFAPPSGQSIFGQQMLPSLSHDAPGVLMQENGGLSMTIV